MKKLLSLLLVAITLLSSGISIFASDTSDVVITASEVSAKPGEYVEIPIVIEKNNGFCGLNIYFTYPEGVTFDSISNSVGELTCTSDATVVWDGADNYTGTGELAVLKVFVSPDAEYGVKHTVKINFIEAYDLDLNDVSASVGEAVINVSCPHFDTEEMAEVPATCTETGYSAGVYCNGCQSVISGHEIIEATGHTYGEWTVTVEPTAATKGEKIRKCVNCDATETEEIDELGSQPSYENPFTDVKGGQWYTEGILWCYANGYMAGVSDTEFGRKSNVTRAMFATILAKIDGVDLSEYEGKTSFSDVKTGQWYSNAIEWAYQNGYAAGLGEGYFGRKDNVSREQIALFFYTYSKINGMDVSEKADLSAFTDLGRVHSWALEAVQWAVAKGLISGTSETTLSPRDPATRAEISLIIKNYVENVNTRI